MGDPALPNIRFLAYSRVSDGLILATYSKNSAASKACKETVERVLGSGNVKANSQVTVTVSTEVGTLHLGAGEHDAVTIMTAADYPRRTAFKLIEELRAILGGQVKEEELAAAKKRDEYRGTCGPFLKEMSQKYEDLQQVDKLVAVNTQVDEVKAVMEQNINKVLENTENLDNLQNKSEDLMYGAKTFKQRAFQIKSIFWWQNLKMKLIIAAICVAICIAVLVPVGIKLAAYSAPFVPTIYYSPPPPPPVSPPPPPRSPPPPPPLPSFPPPKTPGSSV